ncbi:MAG: hypothetical protein NC401_14550 [Ruminococcus sp.]|nr:hypothetical protein [Ruminococcus sp.]
MADLTKCKDCKYYQRLADYHVDPRGLLYDACMCPPHWCAEIRVTLNCPLKDRRNKDKKGGNGNG